jgi:hypothetical protein
MTSKAVGQIKAVATTAVGAVVGALAGGPVGLAIGLAAGAGVDIFRKRAAPGAAGVGPTAAFAAPVAQAAAPGVPTAAAAVAQVPSLPPGADVKAATTAVKLMLIGHPAEVAPGRSWLTTFQKSVGLPGTGAMDAPTRSLLILAEPLAKQLPTPTILG